MLKFLRKYNKYLLAVFCVVLMIAFLIPQAAQQFAPDPTQQTIATTYDGDEIKREQINEAAGVIQTMRRLRLEPPDLIGVSLIPSTGNEFDDALTWLLIQRAAENSGMSASRQAAFNLVAGPLDVQNEKELDEKAKKDFQSNGEFMIKVGRQYLVAEQYRQLAAGVEFTKPRDSNQLASPGLQRNNAILRLNEMVDPVAQQFQQQYGLSQGEGRMFALQQLMFNPETAATLNERLANIIGHERVSTQQISYLLQQQLTELDMTVVVLDAVDREAAVTVEQADMQATFDRYADDEPGTGQPFGLGYRTPNRVKLEALRIPIEQVLKLAESEIKPDDELKYYNANKNQFIDFSSLATGGEVKPMPLTAVLREQIRLLLVQQRAREKAYDIAQEAWVRLKEDERTMQDDGPFKVLPKDFKPTAMTLVKDEIEQKYGFAPEFIQIDNWVSGQDIMQRGIFTEQIYRELPNSEIQIPSGFDSSGIPVPELTLAGRAGLFSSAVLDPANRQQQPITLAQYVTFAKPFVEKDSDRAKFGLQPMLAGRVLSDLTGSSYVFRITDTDPSHPATDMAPIAEKVRDDTRRIKAYEQLAAEKDQLLQRAATQSIEILMHDEKSKQLLEKATRRSIAQPAMKPLDDIQSTGPILMQAFGLADKLAAAGGLDNAAPAERLFVVELPADYKIAVVRLDKIRPVSRGIFEQQATNPDVLISAARLTNRPDEQRPDPLSFESLQAATGFKWAEGFGPDNAESGEKEDAKPEDK